MACVRKHGLQVSEASTLFFFDLCRSSSKASCCSRTTIDYCRSHGLRMSAEQFQCSSAIISLNSGFRIWGLRLKV